MELTKHGKGGSYFYHRNCTVYLMYRHFSKELGHHRLAFEDGFAMTFIDTYILKGKWQLDESDQFMFADNFQNGPYILKEDGSKIVLSDKDCIHVGRYYLNKPYLDVEEFHSDNNVQLDILTYVDGFIDKTVIYYGTILRPTTFFNQPCLWIDQNPDSRSLPHMEFVGGYPNEWCVFLDSLNDNDWNNVLKPDGTKFTQEMIIALIRR